MMGGLFTQRYSDHSDGDRGGDSGTVVVDVDVDIA